MKSKQPLRTRQLAAIHGCKRTLQLDDATYRDLLERVGGVRSAADLSPAGRARVLEEFRRLGAGAAGLMRNAVPAVTTAPNVQAGNEALIGKVGALLADSGRSWNYAHGMARRMFGRQRLEWLRHDELHRLVMALQIDANRRRKRALEAATP
ncbi:MAG: regulatory protein GemA [Proteobacteria bacterium]|nr:regulatory protein GemA [Pseudomonadota bacterium]